MRRIQIDLFISWVLHHVDSNVVPNDEGNSQALVYNLIHLYLGDGAQYHYLPEQDQELSGLFMLEGLPDPFQD